MKLKLTIIILLISFTGLFAQKDTTVIAVLGSSVAAGWVTSYTKKNDMQNGYGHRLGRFLDNSKFKVVNVSVPGDNTKRVLARMEKDLFPLNPDYTIIGLSLGNEGIRGDNKDSVYSAFLKGMKEIISKLKANKIKPVIGSCYSMNGYSDEDYRYTRKMNIKLNGLGYPMINLLGPIDDGKGHITAPYFYDAAHPDNIGHREMFYSIDPAIFTEGKTRPVLTPDDAVCMLPEERKGFSFVPAYEMHSFTLFLNLAEIADGDIVKIGHSEGEIVLSRKGSTISYGEEKAEANGNGNSLAVIHNFLMEVTKIYIDGKEVLKTKQQLKPVEFTFGDMISENGAPVSAIKKMLVYRAPLNLDELKAINEGNLLHASLDYATTFETPESIDELYFTTDAAEEAKAKLYAQIMKAERAEREMPKFPEPELFKLETSKLNDYPGKYELAKDDHFQVIREDDKLFFIDRGNKGELLPTAEDEFYIKHPLAELTIKFTRDVKGEVETLVFNANGHTMNAKKIDK